MTDVPSRPPFVRKWFTPGPWPGGDRPTLAIVREVNLTSSGGTITAKFSRANAKEDVSSPEKLESLFKRIGSRTYNFPHRIEADPKPPFDSPLSLNNDGLHYVIYILKKKSWRFAHDYAPITVDYEASSEAYHESSHINATGNWQQIDGTGIPYIDPQEDCIAAYFIANRHKTHTPDCYADRLNLHIDLLARNHRHEISYMPIIVDPDIRYPGGSG